MDKKFKNKRENIKDYEIMQTLGIGCFGRVRLARNQKTGEFVAIKMLKKEEVIKQKQVDHTINELTVLSEIEHPMIVNLLGFAQDCCYLYFILEYVPGGEIFSYLRGQFKLQEKQAAFFAAQVTLMFTYLHSQNIVYRDLKPENILIAQDGYLKLVDFGLSKYLEGGRTYTLCGTPEYLAPEVLLNKGHGKGVDWWCLGILIYEMNAGIDPFNDEDPMAIYQKILKGVVKFPIDFDKNAKNLVKHLLIADVNKRYGSLKGQENDIKNHAWFSHMDWQQLNNKAIQPIYKPDIKNKSDTSYFSTYPDSEEKAKVVKEKEDPFLNW